MDPNPRPWSRSYQPYSSHDSTSPLVIDAGCWPLRGAGSDPIGDSTTGDGMMDSYVVHTSDGQPDVLVRMPTGI